MQGSRGSRGANPLTSEEEVTTSGSAILQECANRLLDTSKGGLSFVFSGLSAVGSRIYGRARSSDSVCATGSGVDAIFPNPSSSGRTTAGDSVPVPAQESYLAGGGVDIPHGSSTTNNPSIPFEQRGAISASLAGAGTGPSLPCTPTVYRGAEGQHSAQETTTAVRVPDEDHSLPENEFSLGTHSLHGLGRHSAGDQGMYPHSQTFNNATPDSPGHLPGGDLSSSPQVQGRNATPQRLSQTAYEGSPPTEPNVPAEASYPPGYRDPMDAFVSAMQRNSRRLDDLERGVTGSQDEAFSIDARSSHINLIVTLVGLVVMLLAGGTKLYETIHPPSAH